jgi:hypothetical protein
MGTFTSRFTNDDLALPIAAAILMLLADTARGRLTRKRSVALALVLAAGLWTKVYFLAFLPAAPLAAALCPRGRRVCGLRRGTAASFFALLMFLPWLARQKADTGDWLGLTESKGAARAGIGILARIAAIPRVFRPGLFKSLSSTFVYPGAWSAMGAPRHAVLLAAAGIAILILLPWTRAGAASRRGRVAWFGAAIALLAFLAADLAHAATFAVIAGAAGGEGWYLLVLLPVVLSAGAARGKPPGPRAFVLASLCFVAADWICTFGRLAAVYAGEIEGFTPRVPWAAYRGFLLSGEPFRTFSRVGLIEIPAALLAVTGAVWLLALLAPAVVLWRPGLYARPSRTSDKPLPMSSRAVSRSGAR